MSEPTIERLCTNARQAIGQRDWVLAKQSYMLALAQRSDLPDVHYGLATVYFQLRELTSAAHHFREVIRLDPKRAGAHINLGAVHNLLSEYDEAINSLRKGIQLDATRVEGYYNLGLVYKKKGQIDLAIQAYREAVRLNPRMVDAHLNLANLYVEKDQPRQAIPHYQICLQARPDWEKALAGMEKAQHQLAGDKSASALSSAANSRVAPAATSVSGRDMSRPIDPALHTDYLTELHQSAVTTEEVGTEMQHILQNEIETSIKELSSCLLHSGGPRSELDACIQKMESAMFRMSSARQALRNRIRLMAGFAERLAQ